MTHFGGGYDSDDDADVIEGESREVGDDHGGPRRISWKEFLLLALALALAGAILLLLAAFNSCGGGDSQSTGDTDSPTVVPTVVPTRVGVNRSEGRSSEARTGRPHTRGGEPAAFATRFAPQLSSPHAWG